MKTGVVCLFLFMSHDQHFFWLTGISLDRPTSIFVHFQPRSQKPDRKLFYLFSLVKHVAIPNSILHVTPKRPIN